MIPGSLEWWHILVGIGTSVFGLGLAIFGRGFRAWSERLDELSHRFDRRLASMEDSSDKRLSAMEASSERRWHEVERKMEAHEDRMLTFQMDMQRRVSHVEAKVTSWSGGN